MSALQVITRAAAKQKQQCVTRGISRSCCRSLFGPIDHSQLRAELDYELKRIADEKKQRWNFDFMQVKPLRGDFLWERVGSQKTSNFDVNEESNTPVFDRNITQSSIQLSVDSVAINVTSNDRRNCFNTPERLKCKRLRKPPRITDYLCAQKKVGTSRRIKFLKSELGSVKPPKLCKRVQTRQMNRIDGDLKQSTIDKYMLKLRPRFSNGKVRAT